MLDYIKRLLADNDSFGLALGGGAVLGSAHIGVLRALKEKNIDIKAVSGTSIGALIGALFAFGKTPDEIEELAVNMDWLDISGFSLSKMGLMSNKMLGDLLIDQLGEVDIRDAKIPLAIMATNIETGEKVVLRKGPVHKAVMASTCLPGIFIPIDWNKTLLIDGGVVENVPISPLKEMGIKPIIGVDLNSGRKYQRPKDMLEVMTNALEMAINTAAKEQTKDADFVIKPELTGFSKVSNENAKKLIEEGYKSAHEMLQDLD